MTLVACPHFTCSRGLPTSLSRSLMPTNGIRARLASPAARALHAVEKSHSVGLQLSDGILPSQEELLTALLIEAHKTLHKRENQDYIKQLFRNLRKEAAPIDAGLGVEGTSLNTFRQFKVLNVHKYVHSYVQASYLRSWLQKREIEE